MSNQHLDTTSNERGTRNAVAGVLLASSFLIFLVAGCAKGTLTNPNVPTPNPTPTASPTPTPKGTPTPTPSPTPTGSPTPTPTGTPTPSPSPTPTTVSVTISPVIINIAVSGSQQFTATVSGSSNTAVTWTATGGTISTSGLFTAPGTATTITVTATSVADSNKSASAPVLVGGAGTVLGQAAASLTPGTWFHFTAAENSSWANGSVLDLGPNHVGTDNATAWSTKGLWNPVTKEFYFVGGGHCGSGTGCPETQEVLKYNDSTNTWSVPAYLDEGHTYEGPALNITAGANNNIYVRTFSSTTVETFNIASQNWASNLPSVPAGGADCCLAAEYFPDRNSLITIDNDYGAYEYSFASGQWSGCLFGTSSSVGCPNGTHNICGPSSTASPWARYDPVGHRLLFGGCTTVYALSPTLALSQLASSPFDISVGTTASPVTLDPGKGELVSWNASGTTFTSDGSSWVSAGSSPFSDPVGGGLVCASVTTYNVVMCFYAGTNSIPVTSGTVWLYRAQ